MGLKRFDIHKELRKAQKKGLANPKFRAQVIAALCVLTIFLASSYALYTITSDNYHAYSSRVNKIVNIAINPVNGVVEQSKTLSEKILEEKIDTTTFTLGTVATSNGLYQTEDENGTSYYFRGDVDNNYIRFAGMSWRIVRINGTGSVRIIADNPYVSAYASGSGFGASSSGYFQYVYTSLNDFYTSSIAQYENFIATEDSFCLEPIWYSSISSDIPNGDLKCNSKYTISTNPSSNSMGTQMNTLTIDYPVGLISGWEMLYAGARYTNNDTSSDPYYLHTNYNWISSTPVNNSSTLFNGLIGYYKWISTGAHNSFNDVSTINGSSPALTLRGIRPVINLKGDISVKGSGTNNDPYIIVEDSVDTTETFKSTTNTYNLSLADVTGNDYDVKFKVIPNFGYTFDSLKCTNGQSGSYDDIAKEVTIKNVDKNTTCDVNFVPQTYATLLVHNDDLNTYEQMIDELKTTYENEGKKLNVDIIGYKSNVTSKILTSITADTTAKLFRNYIGLVGNYALFDVPTSTTGSGKRSIYASAISNSYEEVSDNNVICSFTPTSSSLNTILLYGINSTLTNYPSHTINNLATYSKYSKFFLNSTTNNAHCHVSKNSDGSLNITNNTTSVGTTIYTDYTKITTERNISDTYIYSPQNNPNELCSDEAKQYLSKQSKYYMKNIGYDRDNTISEYYIYDDVTNACGIIADGYYKTDSNDFQYIAYSLMYKEDTTNYTDQINVKDLLLTKQAIKKLENSSGMGVILVEKSNQSYLLDNAAVLKNLYYFYPGSESNNIDYKKLVVGGQNNISTMTINGSTTSYSTDVLTKEQLKTAIDSLQ